MKWNHPSALLIGLSLAMGGVATPLQARQTSSSVSLPATALFETTISGKVTTIVASLPVETSLAVPTDSASTPANATASESTQNTPSSTAGSDSAGSTAPASNLFPVCRDSEQAFCRPSNNSELYIGQTYYVTWDPAFFADNSTITVILNFYNDTSKQAWSSSSIDNHVGYTTVTISQDWLQGAKANNLTFIAFEYAAGTSGSGGKGSSKAVDGPRIGVTAKPVEHLPANIHKTNPKNLALWIGLPVVLGFVAIMVCGTLIGFRKRRSIGLGNIMSRSRHGYGTRKNRKQRMGKKGAIRLEDRELVAPAQEFRDEPAVGGRHHARDGSLGSLVSDEGDRRNVFRDEMDRQRTGR